MQQELDEEDDDGMSEEEPLIKSKTLHGSNAPMASIALGDATPRRGLEDTLSYCIFFMLGQHSIPTLSSNRIAEN